jgi:hypothetical protein
MRKAWVCLIIVSFLLTGCMDHFYYKPIGDEEQPNLEPGGYSDFLINSNTAVITYEGSTRTSLTRLQKYLLYRAAEVTISNNYDYFIVISTSPSPSFLPKLDPDHGKYYKAPGVIHPFKYSSDFYKVYKYSFHQREYPRFTCFGNKAVITIEMFQGDVPATQPYGFNAMTVVGNTDHALLY